MSFVNDAATPVDLHEQLHILYDYLIRRDETLELEYVKPPLAALCLVEHLVLLKHRAAGGSVATDNMRSASQLNSSRQCGRECYLRAVVDDDV